MHKERAAQQAALQGSLKAVSAIERKGKPKIGVEEFLSLARRFGLSSKTLAKIREALSEEDLGAGPFLAN